MENNYVLANEQGSVRLLAWAQSREWVGAAELTLPAHPKDTARTLLTPLFDRPDRFEHCRVAVDQVMHDWDTPIGHAREIALIPPVSGG